MNAVLENSSVVIIARDVNLSILKPLWLRRNSIFTEDELQGDIVITPVNVHIVAEKFQFTALPDRMQFRIPKDYPEARADISRVLESLVKILPHTPYVAVGLNFDYLFAAKTQEEFDVWGRRLFASPVCAKIVSPDVRNARFGGYASFDILGTRLRADVKPIKAPGNISSLCASWKPGQDLMRANLNFHTDVGNTDAPSEVVLGAIHKWEDASSYAKELVEGMCL